MGECGSRPLAGVIQGAHSPAATGTPSRSQPSEAPTASYAPSCVAHFRPPPTAYVNRGGGVRGGRRLFFLFLKVRRLSSERHPSLTSCPGFPVMSSNPSALPGRDAGRLDDRMMANGGAPSGFGCRGWGDGQRF